MGAAAVFETAAETPPTISDCQLYSSPVLVHSGADQAAPEAISQGVPNRPSWTGDGTKAQRPG